MAEMIKAYIVPPAYRLNRNPGQVPSKKRMRTLGQVQVLSRLGARSGEGANNLVLGKLAGRPERMAMQGKDPFAMPGNLTEERLLAQDDPMLSPGSVVAHMGLDATETAKWTKFLETTTANSQNEVVFRKAVMEKLLESGWEGQMRKAVFARALSHWRTVQKARRFILDLEKGERGPRGGNIIGRDKKGNPIYGKDEPGKVRPKREPVREPREPTTMTEGMKLTAGMLVRGTYGGKPFVGVVQAVRQVETVRGSSVQVGEATIKVDKPATLAGVYGDSEGREVLYAVTTEKGELADSRFVEGAAGKVYGYDVEGEPILDRKAADQRNAGYQAALKGLDEFELRVWDHLLKRKTMVVTGEHARGVERLDPTGKGKPPGNAEEREANQKATRQALQKLWKRGMVSVKSRTGETSVLVPDEGWAYTDQNTDYLRTKLRAVAKYGASAVGKYTGKFKPREDEQSRKSEQFFIDLEKAGQAEMFTLTEPPAPKQEELASTAKRTTSQQFYMGPRGGKWADPEHTIPWGGESGGLAGQQTVLSPTAQDVTRKQHESPVLKDIVERQGRAFTKYLRASIKAREEGDNKAQVVALAQAEKAATNVQAALVELGETREATDWAGYAKKARHRKESVHYGYSILRSERFLLMPDAFQKALFIGPRGGKWADAKHTIPWTPPKGKKVHVIDMTGKDGKVTKLEEPVESMPEKDFEAYIEASTKERKEALAKVKKTLKVGAEYANAEGTQFGVLLKEVAGETPYRVQWYDKQGLSGHSEVGSEEKAAEMLLSDLGYGIEPSPGSFDKLAILTPSRVLPTGWEQIPKGEFKPETIQTGQQVAVRVSWGGIQKYERLASGEFQKVDAPDFKLSPEEFARQVEVYRAQVAVQPVEVPKPTFEIKREPVTLEQLGVWEEGENPEPDITIPEKIKPKWGQHPKQKQAHLPEDPGGVVRAMVPGVMVRRHAEGGQHASVLLKVAENQWARFYVSGRRELGNKIYTDEWAASQVETADNISIVSPPKPKAKPAETFTIPERAVGVEFVGNIARTVDAKGDDVEIIGNIGDPEVRKRVAEIRVEQQEGKPETRKDLQAAGYRNVGKSSDLHRYGYNISHWFNVKTKEQAVEYVPRTEPGKWSAKGRPSYVTRTYEQQVAVHEAIGAPVQPPESAGPAQGEMFRSEEKAMPATAQILTPDELRKHLYEWKEVQGGKTVYHYTGKKAGKRADKRKVKKLREQVEELKENIKQAHAAGDIVAERKVRHQAAKLLRDVARLTGKKKWEKRAEKIIQTQTFASQPVTVTRSMDAQPLQKAEARGGTYYKRMPTAKAGNKKKWRYFYEQDKYDGRDDAHTGGEDNARTHLSRKIMKCVGEKGCDAKAMGPLVKKFGAKKVAEVLRENQKGGTLAFKKGRFSLCKRKG